jgi:hypothetical protein
MYGVAAEVAQKVVVLFQHGDLDPSAGQQQSVHHACGAAAGDTNLGLQNLRHAPTLRRRSTGSGHLPVGTQRLDLALEILCRLERPVHRGESQIGDFIEFA